MTYTIELLTFGAGLVRDSEAGKWYQVSPWDDGHKVEDSYVNQVRTSKHAGATTPSDHPLFKGTLTTQTDSFEEAKRIVKAAISFQGLMSSLAGIYLEPKVNPNRFRGTYEWAKQEIHDKGYVDVLRANEGFRNSSLNDLLDLSFDEAVNKFRTETDNAKR